MQKHEKICRFCLENCSNNFKVVGENATKLLGVFLEPNLAVSEEAVMCSNCTDSFKACCNFKSTCHDTEDFIVQFINCKDNNTKLNLKDVYRSREACDVPEDHDICRLCLDLLKISSFISLDSEEGGIALEKILEKCIPELDLHVTEKPGLCVPCCESLQRYFKFVTNCLIVQKKITNYCEAANGDSTSLIKLKDVLEFSTKNIFDKADRIKMEHRLYKDEDHVNVQKCSNRVPCTSDNMFTNKGVGRIKLEEVFPKEKVCKINLKPENLTEMGGQQFNDVPKCMIKCEKVDDQFDDRIEPKYCQEMVNELELKQIYLKSFQDCDISPQMNTDFNLPKMQEFSLTQPHTTLPQVLFDKSAKKIQNQPLKYVSTQRYASGRKEHQCNFCAFQTKHKSCLNRHQLVHKNSSILYHCEHCSFETKHKQSLNNHLLIHKNSSEIAMNHCQFCPYQTRYKRYLKVHLLTHKNPSEITMYHCEHCPFLTKRKSDLKKHLLSHKNPSEIPMYQCEHCSFLTKRKGTIKSHLLTHKNPSEITLYQCEHCSFQTKYKYQVKKHLLIHKNPSEVTMYQCEYCLFQSRYKKSLKQHLLTHKNPPQ